MNDCGPLFDRQVIKETGILGEDRIRWVSPLKDDEYAEYRDQDFLNRLGLTLTKRSLDSFWPNLGPQWDALGRTEAGRIILIEAKANIPEVVSPATGAGPKSRVLIEKSIAETQKFLGVDENISWTGKLYQYTNRLAHLYLLRELNDIDAYLIFVYFVGAEDVNGPQTIAEWKSALTVTKLILGLNEHHKLSKYVADIFIDVGQIANAA